MLFDRLQYLILSCDLYVQAEGWNYLVSYVLESEMFPQVFKALSILKDEELGVNWCSLPKLDVVEIDDDGNALSALAFFLALMALIRKNSNVLYKSNTIERAVGKRS